MEGAHPDALRRLSPHRLPQPALHLSGGTIGERQAENLGRRHAEPVREMVDPGRKDGRLAGARASDDAHGVRTAGATRMSCGGVVVEDGRALLVVELEMTTMMRRR